MKNRTLNVIVIVLAVALGLILFTSDRGISRIVEECGELISNTLDL